MAHSPNSPTNLSPEFTGPPTRYSIVVYNNESIAAHEVESVEEVLALADPAKVNWVTVRHVHEKRELLMVLAHFGIDPIILPDILDDSAVEFDAEYDDCLYLEYVVPHLSDETNQLEPSTGSFVLGTNFLIVFEHELHRLLARTRRRVMNHQTKVKQYGPDYLLYLLLHGFVVENYQRSFKYLTVQLEKQEDFVLASAGDEAAFKSTLALRESIKPWNEPLLEMVNFLEYVKDAESKFITPEVTKLFAKTLEREIDNLLAYYDRLRQWLKEILDLHLANVERNTGKINQLLTIIATIFLPITFIASIYGMNFDFMPELNWKFGYPLTLLLMAVVAGSLIIFMKRRKWF